MSVREAKQCTLPSDVSLLLTLLFSLYTTGTLLSVFVLKWQIISFGFVCIQFCALTWYMLTYVPYGQQCMKMVIKRLTK